MPDVRVNGVSLHYVVHGKGPSVIMVHGSWGDADNWAQVLPLFAEHCRVVAYDRRGHSCSERPPAQGSVHEDVDDLAALVETLYLDPVFVCGNSFGALVTLRLAYLRPELVRGIAVHEVFRTLASAPAGSPDMARGSRTSWPSPATAASGSTSGPET
jgi:pimeloyl-ACP methyl ester carboxylesterase